MKLRIVRRKPLRENLTREEELEYEMFGQETEEESERAELSDFVKNESQALNRALDPATPEFLLKKLATSGYYKVRKFALTNPNLKDKDFIINRLLREKSWEVLRDAAKELIRNKLDDDEILELARRLPKSSNGNSIRFRILRAARNITDELVRTILSAFDEDDKETAAEILGERDDFLDLSKDTLEEIAHYAKSDVFAVGSILHKHKNIPEWMLEVFVEKLVYEKRYIDIANIVIEYPGATRKILNDLAHFLVDNKEYWERSEYKYDEYIEALEKLIDNPKVSPEIKDSIRLLNVI